MSARPSTPTTVRAASVTYALVGTTLRYTVKLVNEFGGPVAGASVRVSLYEWVYTGYLWFSNGVTDSQGNAQFQLLERGLRVLYDRCRKCGGRRG